jgi:hypothetical protein
MLPKIDCRTIPKYQKHNNEMPYFGWYTCIYMYFGLLIWDRRGRDRMVVGFTTTYAIGTYHHLSCEF